jgi:hypothetical protein
MASRLRTWNHNIFTELNTKVQHFLWTIQGDGQAKQKRRLTAKKRLAAGVETGGIGIPHPGEIITGFQQNFIYKIYIQGSLNPRVTCLPSFLAY